MKDYRLRPLATRICCFIALFVVLASTVVAVPQNDLADMNRSAPAYNSNGGDLCTTAGIPSTGTGDSTDAGNTFVAWNSGLQPPYIMEQYIIEVLKYIADFKGVPRESVVTQEHVLALLAFAWGEGGDINNRSTFNLFNTSALRNDPEAMPYAAGGSDGRQAYANFDVGIKATGGTMLLPRYTRLIDALIDPNSTASQVLYNYTHYSQFPGNGWWAEQNEIDGEAAYYNKMLGFLSGMKNNYKNRASTIIGTPEREQQTGARDPSKLTYDGEGAAAVVDPTDQPTGSGPSSSSGGGCGPAGGGGEGGIAQVDGFTFPLITTKTALDVGANGAKWCMKSQSNCHHDYNAADIHVAVGTRVVAAKEGVVVLARNSDGNCGSSVAILGSDDQVYYYTHMLDGSVGVGVGDSVSGGTQLGTVGDKACGTAPHLHFDIQPPPAKNRPGCSGAECRKYTFLDVQPVLLKAYEELPQ